MKRIFGKRTLTLQAVSAYHEHLSDPRKVAVVMIWSGKAFIHEDSELEKTLEEETLSDAWIQEYRHRPFGIPPLSPVVLECGVISGYLEGRLGRLIPGNVDNVVISQVGCPAISRRRQGLETPWDCR